MSGRRLLTTWLGLAAPAAAQFNGTRIMIDAGHGGTDPGSLGIDGSAYPNEEDFVLDVALRLQSRLQAAGAEVILTRTSDATTSLTTRRDLANLEDPDIFLSIHCNSFTDTATGGTETYWWAGGDGADQSLATLVQSRLLESFPLRDRGIKQANFTVLTANPPSALAEMMFISNQAEFNLMNVGANREAESLGLYKACADFLGIDLTAPSFSLQPVSTTHSPGQTASFTAGSPDPGLSWRWQRHGVDLSDGPGISGSGSPNLTLANVSLADAGFYTVRLSGGGLPVVSREAQLVISSPPTPPGQGNGLRAWYYNNPDFSALQFVRVDSTIGFDWQAAPPAAPMQPDTFSVRWTGQVEPRYTQPCTFHVRTSDGVRLWLNGALLIDRWQDQTPMEVSATAFLTAGQKVDLIMEYYDGAGDAVAELSWSSPSQLKEIIPASQLHRPPPVLSGPDEVWMVEGGTAVFSAAVTSFDPLLASQTLADFETFPPGSSDLVMFRRPALAGGTLGFLDTTQTETTTVTSILPEGNPSTRAIRAEWTFKADAVNPWLRFSTSNAPSLGNPVIDFRKGLRFDIWTAQPMRLGLGLRETNSTGTIGSNGGTTGTTEFIGVPTLTTRPEPSRLLSASVWHTVDFDIPREPVQPFTGNGLLTTTSGKGVLEQLALVPDGPPGPQLVMVDNFVITDPNYLTWSLAAPVPGVSINPVTGAVTWQPAAGSGGQPIAITIQSTDAGTPPLTATRIIQLIAAPPPVILSALTADGRFALSWRSAAGARYRIESADSPAGPWAPQLPLLNATGPQLSWSVPITPGTRAFYRVRLEF